jgi:hypothetical protein
MRTKDQLLLEEAYQKIYLKENDYYVNLNGDVVKKHKDHKITLGGKVNLAGDVVPDENSIESSNENKEDGPIPILRNLGDTSKERINKARENGEDILKVIAQLEKESGSVPARLARSLQHRKVISDDEYRNYLNSINSSNTTSDMTYAKRGGYVESFVHGIQPIVEAKKKVNPWAIEKSIENKTGKKFGKKHKEEIIKGIKKSAKKSGKEITSDKVKGKNKK